MDTPRCADDTHGMNDPVAVRAPLVGRGPELTQLRRALDAAGAGRGSCWFLLGDPGSGKTRLAFELLQEARARRMAVLSGGASGVVPLPAYGLVARALRSRVPGWRPTDAPVDAYAGGLAAVLPEWPTPPTALQRTADQRRLLAAEGTWQLLQHAARPTAGQDRRRGAVVCFDDLQWATPRAWRWSTTFR